MQPHFHLHSLALTKKSYDSNPSQTSQGYAALKQNPQPLEAFYLLFCKPFLLSDHIVLPGWLSDTSSGMFGQVTSCLLKQEGNILDLDIALPRHARQS